MTSDNKIIGTIIGVTLLLVVGMVIFSKNNSSIITPADITDGQVTQAYSPHTGSTAAPLQLVEFGDFQCPACGQLAYPLIKQAIAEYGDKINFTWRHLPLTSIHQNALSASKAAEAAGAQDKFFEMYDLIFTNQKDWSNLRDATETFANYATSLGLDMTKYRADLLNETLLGHISTDMGDSNALGVDSVPTLFLNGQKMATIVSYEALKAALDQVLAN